MPDEIAQLATLLDRLTGERAMLVAPLRVPIGAPLPLDPPCIRHLCLSLTAGDKHGRPARVRAPHRGARRKRKGSWVGWCKGLACLFICPPTLTCSLRVAAPG